LVNGFGYRIDFVPRHFHFFLDKSLGHGGFLHFFIFAERAQYASPFGVPGAMVAPFCPYRMVRLRPLGEVTTFLKRFWMAPISTSFYRPWASCRPSCLCISFSWLFGFWLSFKLPYDKVH
jgi:hypothetical protein